MRRPVSHGMRHAVSQGTDTMNHWYTAGLYHWYRARGKGRLYQWYTNGLQRKLRMFTAVYAYHPNTRSCTQVNTVH